METITEKHFTAPENNPAPAVVKFTNFSDEDFTYTWNKIPYTFKAGAVKFMETGIANHFAKHLVNRELLKRGRDNDTSPKKQSDNPFFMEFWNKCIQPIPMDASGDADKARQEMIDQNMKAQLANEHAPGTEAPAPAKGGKKLPAKKDADEFEEVPVPEGAADEE